MKRAKRRASPVTMRHILRDLGIMGNPTFDQDSIRVLLSSKVVVAASGEVLQQAGNVVYVGPEMVRAQ